MSYHLRVYPADISHADLHSACGDHCLQQLVAQLLVRARIWGKDTLTVSFLLFVSSINSWAAWNNGLGGCGDDVGDSRMYLGGGGPCVEHPE